MKINFEQSIKETLIGKKLISADDDPFEGNPVVTDVVIIGDGLNLQCGEKDSYYVSLNETLEIE